MKKERVFWGGLFILCGIFLIISKLKYFPNVNLISLLLTLFFAVVIIKSIPKLNFAGILFPIAFICIIYAKELRITAITPWTVLFAALFATIGLSIIFHKSIKCGSIKYDFKNSNFEKIDVEDEGHISFNNSFCATTKYINTNNFEQADFKYSFGALKVYFDNAVMSKDNAIVRLDASFSGVELYVPKTWNVKVKTNVILGSVNEKNRSNQVATNTLTLVGDISFSGVEIIYI